MRELDSILTLWTSAGDCGADAVLATVVDVRGSSYRRPGARLLITSDGRREGSISGGCLESDVAKKAWWWTENGSVVRMYDTSSDEEGNPQFGLGCNGVIRVLIERLGKPDSNAAIAFLNRCRVEREAGVMATIIASPSPDVARVGSRWFLAPDGYTDGDIADLMVRDWIEAEADAALWERRSRMLLVPHTLGNVEVFVELIAPPVPLFVFGAGPDVAPVVRIAKEIGWHVTVVDARHAQPQTRNFQEANAVIRTSVEQPLNGVSIDRHSVAVVMNHSYPVDASVLRALIDARPEFIGMLGPRSRTGRILEELNITNVPDSLHAPVGLDIGADTPELIALSIVAEIQTALTKRTARMLRTLAAERQASSQPSKSVALCA